ncbi:MAG: Mce-associated rane protein [Frankiaceae bacterium]|nr:Mce-associated rane protein [Frankiaceae bacterium]
MPADESTAPPGAEPTPVPEPEPTPVPTPEPTLVAGDVPANEPVTAPPPVEPPAPAAVEPPPAPEPAPEPEPERIVPREEPAPIVPPVTVPLPTEPAPPPPAPEPPAPPVEPDPPAPDPPTTTTLDASLAAAAATTTETAPPPVVPDAPADDVADTEPADDLPRRGRRNAVVAVLVAVVLVAVLGLVVAGPIAGWRAADRLDHRRTEALADARRLALNIGSIDYKFLDRDLARISDSTTGKARTEFDAKILKNDAYKTLVKDNQAVLSSSIQRIGLEPCGADDRACKRGDSAVVLVFLDQESRNKLRPTPRVDRNRVALTLVRRGKTWLISEVAVI